MYVNDLRCLVVIACYVDNFNILAKANFHFAQEATLINILEVSLNKTYAQNKFAAVRQSCVGGCDTKYKG